LRDARHLGSTGCQPVSFGSLQNIKGVHAFKRKRMQERLELYRQRKPYRQESKLKAR
jgi:hypothetical protein